MAKKAIEGCYPTDPADRWTLKQAIYELSIDIDRITDPTAKAKAQQSLLSLVTKNGRGGNQPASITINNTAITKATAAPIVAWATPIIEKILDPPINAGATTTATNGGTSGTQAPQASTTTNPGGTSGAQLQQQTLASATTTTAGGTSSTPAPYASTTTNNLGGTSGAQLQYQTSASATTLSGTSSTPAPHASTTTNNLGGTSGAQFQQTATKQVTFGGATTPDPHAAQKAHHAAVFNTGPASVHTSLYGQPPPAKQAKLSYDTGFDALPMSAKLAHLTFSRVMKAEHLSPNLLALLNQPTEERFTYFNTHCMRRLTEKDPEAWAGFNFTAKFVNDLCNGKLTTNDATNSWWNGLIGNHMHRDPTEIKSLNQLHSLIHKRDNSVQFQVNARQ